MARQRLDEGGVEGGVSVNVMEWNPAVNCDLMELGLHAAS